MCRIFVLLLLASTEFRKILRKHRNSAATGKFRGSAQNSACRGKLWSLSITLLQYAQTKPSQHLYSIKIGPMLSGHWLVSFNLQQSL